MTLGSYIMKLQILRPLPPCRGSFTLSPLCLGLFLSYFFNDNFKLPFNGFLVCYFYYFLWTSLLVSSQEKNTMKTSDVMGTQR